MSIPRSLPFLTLLLAFLLFFYWPQPMSLPTNEQPIHCSITESGYDEHHNLTQTRYLIEDPQLQEELINLINNYYYHRRLINSPFVASNTLGYGITLYYADEKHHRLTLALSPYDYNRYYPSTESFTCQLYTNLGQPLSREIQQLLLHAEEQLIVAYSSKGATE